MKHLCLYILFTYYMNVVTFAEEKEIKKIINQYSIFLFSEMKKIGLIVFYLNFSFIYIHRELTVNLQISSFSNILDLLVNVFIP